MIKLTSLISILLFLSIVLGAQTIVNVNIANHLLNFQYLTNNGNVNQEFSIAYIHDYIVGITSSNNDTVEFITQDSEAFHLNVYDILSNQSKIVSSISYNYSNPTYQNNYYYQTIQSNTPSNSEPTYIYNLIGNGNMGYLMYITLNFIESSYNESRANVYQKSISSYYSSGFDYYSNTFYLSYISSGCVYFEGIDTNTREYTTPLPPKCISPVSKFDHVVPVMYNSTKYLISAYFDSKEILMKTFAYNSTKVISMDIFKFINIPNDDKNWIEPYRFVAVQDQYITIASASYLGKVQYNTINLNDYSLTSFMITPTYRVDSIFTF